MLLQTEFENSNRYLRNLKVDKFFRVYEQWKRKQHLATIYNIMMKPIHDVNLTKYPKNYLKTKSQARQGMLILSKTNLTKGIKYPFN